jgi:cyclic pyranopterin phosphate synthase
MAQHDSTPAAENRLVDGFGRVARSLRVSVTDRCNLRCLYCMPESGIAWFDKQLILTFEEIERVVRLLVENGIREVRLTGGEPLLRRDLPTLVRMLAPLPGLDEVAVTTNGLLLPELAEPLLAAGVTRFNVHLDALEASTFREASRRDALPRALAGLQELERLGAVPIKVNVVLMRGVNDQEIERFAELARTRPYQVRFIEMMPLGGGERFEAERLIPGAEVRRRIEALYPLQPVGRDRPSAPATVYRFADGVGDIGFINSVTEPFCAGCDRLRLTADGMVRNCLFARTETDLRPILRGGGSDADLLRALVGEVARKERGGSLDLRDYYVERLPRKMWQIGG